ncbi:MAG: CapA family protein [Candidatus Cyclobacteriaceae bacterium M3_2C_046]
MRSINYIFSFLLLLGLMSSCKAPKSTLDPSMKLENAAYQAYINSVRLLISDTLMGSQAQFPLAKITSRRLKDTITVIGVGDIMLGTNFPSPDYLPPNDGRDLLAPVLDILQDADLTFGNLEGVILNQGGDPKTCSNPDLCYLFRSPEHYITHLVEAGFDVVSIANNHAGDFGDPGRDNTMRVLDSVKLQYAGQLQKPFTIFNLDGMIYGFVAFAPNTNTIRINDLANAEKIVSHLDTLADIVIVSFHGGAEGSKYQHITRETEFFYGENRGNVYEFAHRMIDVGADIIFGHGPHVTRAVDIYKNRFIAYSLGNFCTYARFNLRGENGLAPIIKVYTDHKGNFFKAKIHPIIQVGEGGPVPDPKRRVIKTLQRLNQEDFPESGITITDDGWIFSPKHTSLSVGF